MSARAAELLGEFSREVLDMRIARSQERDGMLNPDELAALLDVYAEFGR